MTLTPWGQSTAADGAEKGSGAVTISVDQARETAAEPAKPVRASRFTIEIDTGGTFTDGYVTGGGDVVIAKAETTPFDLSVGVLACLDHAAEQLGLTRSALLRDTAVVRLSTTVGTNTLINRNGPAIGLILDTGNEGQLLRLAPELPFDRRLAVVLGGSPDVAEVQTHVRQLLESGARVIAIALSGGSDLAERENAVRAAIARSYPRHYLGAVPVLPSHQVTPLGDDRLRIQTTVLSAYLHPVMSRFLYRVEDALRADGYAHPLLIANANGGTSRTAKTAALRTWGSGPAGGVSATATMAGELALPVAVGFDVGGTSTDIAVIADGAWTYEVQPSIEGIEVAMPALALVSAPIGGGTIARVIDGRLRLGPDSAGAQPGPACFGLGGSDATVTDAACHLGLFDPAHFLGGRKSLDPAAAEAVLERLAAELGGSADDAATRIISAAGAAIGAAIETELAKRSIAARDAELLATGGAGGMLAAYVQQASGAAATVAFPVSAVFSAFGLSRLDVVHTYDIPADAASLVAATSDARSRALIDMRTEGFPPDEVVFALEAEVPAADGSVSVRRSARADLDPTEAAAGARLIRVVARSATTRAELPRAGGAAAEPIAQRSVRWGAEVRPTPVYDWTSLAKGSVIAGPAIVETTETTLAVPPGFDAAIGAMGEARLTTR